MSNNVNEHAEIIANLVFHSYPHKAMGFNPNEPHAEDCEGCLINAEVAKLVVKLNALSDVEKTLSELEEVKKELSILKLDRWRAFEYAGVAEEGPLAVLVAGLLNERKHFSRLLQTIKNDINSIASKIH